MEVCLRYTPLMVFYDGDPENFGCFQILQEKACTKSLRGKEMKSSSA